MYSQKWVLKYSYRIGTWHAARKQCCRNVCQIWKGHNHQLTSICGIWCQLNSVSRHFMSIDVCIFANFRNIAHWSLVFSSLTPSPGPIVAKSHSSIWLHQEHFILQFISKLNFCASKLANNLIEKKKLANNRMLLNSIFVYGLFFYNFYSNAHCVATNMIVLHFYACFVSQ